MRRICVTGPESTGKTMLAQRLARSLGTEWVPEAARVYAERVARPLTIDDVLPIAREHIALADAAAGRVAARRGSQLLLDTDLISTVLYGRFYYELQSSWLEAEARARRADVYLLCDVDVPWVADGVRDRPAQRDEMFALFRETLREFGANVVVINGDWSLRQEAAMRIVRAAD
jgi:NadR type nicotinamide-nucleotide adenylyltransferase